MGKQNGPKSHSRGAAWSADAPAIDDNALKTCGIAA
jgi:hypothetical protein